MARARELVMRCQWLKSRGYWAGYQCSNSACVCRDGVWLCVLHLGMYTDGRPTCEGHSLLVSEHGRWRDRNGLCKVCGKSALCGGQERE